MKELKNLEVAGYTQEEVKEAREFLLENKHAGCVGYVDFPNGRELRYEQNAIGFAWRYAKYPTTDFVILRGGNCRQVMAIPHVAR